MKNQNNIAGLRDEYRQDGLSEVEFHENPIRQFEIWMQEAIDADIHQPNAMTLATATKEGRPSARIILLKEVNEQGFVFFTNYHSRKGKELEANPRASILFLWLPLSRQIRVEGRVERVDAVVSDAYFKTRPRGSQISAWVSEQSSVIKGRDELENEYKEIERKYENRDIPRPDYWGGYVIVPDSVEFWQGRPSRLHDRLSYRRIDKTTWLLQRLAP